MRRRIAWGVGLLALVGGVVVVANHGGMRLSDDAGPQVSRASQAINASLAHVSQAHGAQSGSPQTGPSEEILRLTATLDPEAGAFYAPRFDTPLRGYGPVVDGYSLQELLALSPIFGPKTPGTRAAWSGTSCAACHSWTPATLCVQAQTYADPDFDAASAPPHPFGAAFKTALGSWAVQGCL